MALTIGVAPAAASAKRSPKRPCKRSSRIVVPWPWTCGDHPKALETTESQSLTQGPDLVQCPETRSQEKRLNPKYPVLLNPTTSDPLPRPSGLPMGLPQLQFKPQTKPQPALYDHKTLSSREYLRSSYELYMPAHKKHPWVLTGSAC